MSRKQKGPVMLHQPAGEDNSSLAVLESMSSLTSISESFLGASDNSDFESDNKTPQCLDSKKIAKEIYKW